MAGRAGLQVCMKNTRQTEILSSSACMGYERGGAEQGRTARVVYIKKIALMYVN